MLPIRAYHAILTAYGFWLPNDPRGSWSEYVRQWDPFHFGKATKVDTHRSLARHPHDRQRRWQARQALKYPPVQFTGKQVLAVATGFKQAIEGIVLHGPCMFDSSRTRALGHRPA